MAVEGFAVFEPALGDFQQIGSASWSRHPHRGGALRGAFCSRRSTCCGSAGRALCRPTRCNRLRKTRRPGLSTFLAAFLWRSISRPHTPHRLTRSERAFGNRVPQRERSSDVPAGETSTKGVPVLAALQFRVSKNSPLPSSATAHFRPRSFSPLRIVSRIRSGPTARKPRHFTAWSAT